MLTDVLGYLRCPVCGDPLAGSGGTTGPAPAVLCCRNGHSFDVSRPGYVNLTTGRRSHPGDTAAMVVAREAFLAAGGYAFIAAALAGAAASYPTWSGPELVLDVGAGTGYHLAAVLAARPDAVGLAVDVSKPALRRAARAHPRIGAVLADAWGRLPVADRSTAVLLNVFAPRNGAEFRRVLHTDGALLSVTPGADHLAELVRRLELLRVDPDKASRVAASLTPWFRPGASSVHRHRLLLDREQVRALVEMGPSAWHADRPALTAAIAALPDPVPVTAAVQLTHWHPS